MVLLSLQTRVQNALAEIRPYILSDGGEIELINIQNNIVSVKLTGACQSCPMSSFTLTMGIETAIREHAPEITSVELISE